MNLMYWRIWSNCAVFNDGFISPRVQTLHSLLRLCIVLSGSEVKHLWGSICLWCITFDTSFQTGAAARCFLSRKPFKLQWITRATQNNAEERKVYIKIRVFSEDKIDSSSSLLCKSITCKLRLRATHVFWIWASSLLWLRNNSSVMWENRETSRLIVLRFLVFCWLWIIRKVAMILLQTEVLFIKTSWKHAIYKAVFFPQMWGMIINAQYNVVTFLCLI